jgi:hypothetical protein
MIVVGPWRTGQTLLVSVLLSGLTMLGLCSSDAAQTVTLAWDPSLDANVTGYRVYYGVASGVYTGQVSVSGTTRATVSGLIEGHTYYFAVTAHDAMGLESLPSNEIAYLVPGVFLTLQKIQLSGFPNAFLISSTGVAPYAWALEATENFRTWQVLSRGTNSPVNVAVMTSGTPQLFFRLRRQ